MKNKAITIMLGFVIFLLCIYMFCQSGTRVMDKWKSEFRRELSETAQKSFSPGLYYVTYGEKNDEKWLEKQVKYCFPFSEYLSEQTIQIVQSEDVFTYQMLLEQQARDDERISEDLIGTTSSSAEVVSGAVIENSLSLEKLQDFNYLVSKLYTVDSTTTIGPEQLNAKELLSKDMHINKSKKGPKVLIFHTHSQESFADSKSGDPNTSIVGMGAYLAKKLNEMGIETIHHDGVYDLIDGKLDRSKAYEMSEQGVRKILKEYPSIEVVIDLHRDGVKEDLHLVTECRWRR